LLTEDKNNTRSAKSTHKLIALVTLNARGQETSAFLDKETETAERTEAEHRERIALGKRIDILDELRLPAVSMRPLLCPLVSILT
jgi:hypothetical protein